VNDPAPKPYKHSLRVLSHPDRLQRVLDNAEAFQKEKAKEAPMQQAPAPVQPAESTPAHSIERKLLEARIIETLRTIYDPELPVNIYDLGLIYGVDVRDDRSVEIRMTLTAPACPVAGQIVAEVQAKVQNLDEVTSADVELVWDPPWSRERMSEAAQLDLGLL
jgi:FeS assembly SUF system protein